MYTVLLHFNYTTLDFLCKEGNGKIRRFLHLIHIYTGFFFTQEKTFFQFPCKAVLAHRHGFRPLYSIQDVRRGLISFTHPSAKRKFPDRFLDKAKKP